MLYGKLPLTEIQQEANTKFEYAAEAFRKDILKPFCKRHGLTYHSLEGGPSLHNSNGMPLSVANPVSWVIYSILLTPVIGKKHFSNFVKDVGPEDLEGVPAIDYTELGIDIEKIWTSHPGFRGRETAIAESDFEKAKKVLTEAGFNVAFEPRGGTSDKPCRIRWWPNS